MQTDKRRGWECKRRKLWKRVRAEQIRAEEREKGAEQIRELLE